MHRHHDHHGGPPPPARFLAALGGIALLKAALHRHASMRGSRSHPYARGGLRYGGHDAWCEHRRDHRVMRNRDRHGSHDRRHFADDIEI